MKIDEAIKELKIEYLGDSEKMKQAKDVAVKALEELQAYKEAWNKMQEEIEKINPDDNSYSVKNNACLIVSTYRPKERDKE